eukprot:3866046-Pyramimonas_sp.AAC.1
MANRAAGMHGFRAARKREKTLVMTRELLALGIDSHSETRKVGGGGFKVRAGGFEVLGGGFEVGGGGFKIGGGGCNFQVAVREHFVGLCTCTASSQPRRLANATLRVMSRVAFPHPASKSAANNSQGEDRIRWR